MGGELEKRIRYCDRITKASGSNLWMVSRALPAAKHRFFTVAYSSMRVIDDFVDDEFMALDPAGREAERGAAEAKVALWVEQSEAAAQREFVATERSYEPEIFLAMNEMLGRSTLGAGPWRGLGGALTDDIRERRLGTWADFLHYCSGATVAPAHIFLFVLACQESGGDYLHDPALPIADYAHDMGVFCYLVHICRDVKKDALAGGEQLVTVPADVLGAHGLEAATLKEDLDGGSGERARSMVEDLLERAAEFRGRSEQHLGVLLGVLGKREGAVLRGLLGVYMKLHDALVADPMAAVRGEELLGFRDKLKILGAAGLGVGDFVH